MRLLSTVACVLGMLGLLISSAPTIAARNILQIESGWQDTVLSMHNDLRAKHQAPDLTWFQDLEASAQQYSDQCVFQHSGTDGEGENLAIGTGMDVQGLVQMWEDEEQNYTYGESDPSNFSDVGHFTQMVWVGTTTIGCGLSDCGDQGLYLVCRYTPQGNFAGQYADNVLPPA